MEARYSGGEEVANVVTHAVGLLASVVGVGVLVYLGVVRDEALHVATAGVYGATLVALYAASTLYHAFRRPGVKRVLRVLDHCAIYLLIAGTYTPFVLVGLGGGWGWTLFGLVWAMAVAGIVFKVFATGRFAVMSTVAYVAMGWLGVVALKPLIEALSPGALVWLLAGGISYTAGTLFYHRKIPYSHALWHVFVLLGSVCHFVAIALYVLV
ncbi:hemolysin III family protein [Rubrobacter tropicus]|uniref:Hemolysin III family protein n=1 Tax=Rubrobacter tropicus TaxID=2653851 RepID=A0A6G8QAL4_9ACTN|nr:hemolysin III family protein [Rubrobacter tropicus]QIN83534.1 hemolysin III family protein [Rubrobacter tropicus]